MKMLRFCVLISGYYHCFKSEGHRLPDGDLCLCYIIRKNKLSVSKNALRVFLIIMLAVDFFIYTETRSCAGTCTNDTEILWDRIPFSLFPWYCWLLPKSYGIFFVLLTSGHGLPQSTDSQWYLDYANALVANFCDGVDMNDVLYLGYNLLLSLLLYIFKDPVIIVFIQAVTAALGVILVYKIANMLFNRTTAIIAALFYCAAWDITLWSMYILSDSFFYQPIIAMRLLFADGAGVAPAEVSNAICRGTFCT